MNHALSWSYKHASMPAWYCMVLTLPSGLEWHCCRPQEVFQDAQSPVEETPYPPDEFLEDTHVDTPDQEVGPFVAYVGFHGGLWTAKNGPKTLCVEGLLAPFFAVQRSLMISSFGRWHMMMNLKKQHLPWRRPPTGKRRLANGVSE